MGDVTKTEPKRTRCTSLQQAFEQHPVQRPHRAYYPFSGIQVYRKHMAGAGRVNRVEGTSPSLCLGFSCRSLPDPLQVRLVLVHQGLSPLYFRGRRDGEHETGVHPTSVVKET